DESGQEGRKTARLMSLGTVDGEPRVVDPDGQRGPRRRLAFPQFRRMLRSWARDTKSWPFTCSTAANHSSFTAPGDRAPRMPPAIDATESLSPPTFAARRIAASADSMTVASASARGTIVIG